MAEGKGEERCWEGKGRGVAAWGEGEGCEGGQNWTEINGVADDNEDALLLINDDAPRPDGEVGKDAIMFTNHVCAAPFGGVGEGAGGGSLVLQK